MIIAQWIILGLSLCMFLICLFVYRSEAKNGKVIHVALFIQIILHFGANIYFALLPLSKFHMLWVIPCCYVFGWIIGFLITPLPVLGDLMRNISIVFAHIFFVGINWELGGYSWEISTMRAIRSRQRSENYNSVEELQEAIKQREDLLFGYCLYYQGIKHLYKDNQEVLDNTDFHYNEIKERTEKSVLKAKDLLNKLQTGSVSTKELVNFSFPPIQGFGLDEMTERAFLLVGAYEKTFPDRPRQNELTQDEYYVLMDAVC